MASPIANTPNEVIENILVHYYLDRSNLPRGQHDSPVLLVSKSFRALGLSALSKVIRSKGMTEYPTSRHIELNKQVMLAAICRTLAPVQSDPAVTRTPEHLLLDFGNCSYTVAELSKGIFRQALSTSLRLLTVSFVMAHSVTQKDMRECLDLASVLRQLQELRFICRVDSRQYDLQGNFVGNLDNVLHANIRTNRRWKLHTAYTDEDLQDAALRQFAEARHYRLLRAVRTGLREPGACTERLIV